MRIVAVLATLALAASAWYAPTVREARRSDISRAPFVVADPVERIRVGEREASLGVQLAGYDQLLRDGSEDPAHVRGKIRTCLLLGAAVDRQPGLSQLVQKEIAAYVEHHERIDPDGSFLRGLMREWLELKVEDRDVFYQRVSVLIFEASKGDKKALAELLAYNERGPFYSQFFPFARLHALSWKVVDPMVRYQFARPGNIQGMIEASYTLLWYESVFGVGTELLDQHLDDIRDAFKAFRGKLARPNRNDNVLLSTGVSAVRGMALLAMRGDRDFATILRSAEPIEMPYHIKHLEAARFALGKMPRPGQKVFEELDADVRDFLFYAASARAGLLRRQLAEQDDPDAADRLDAALKMVRAGHQSTSPLMRGVLFMVLYRVGTDADRARVDEVLAGGGIPGLYAASIKPPANPAASFFPALKLTPQLGARARGGDAGVRRSVAAVPVLIRPGHSFGTRKNEDPSPGPRLCSGGRT